MEEYKKEKEEYRKLLVKGITLLIGFSIMCIGVNLLLRLELNYVFSSGFIFLTVLNQFLFWVSGVWSLNWRKRLFFSLLINVPLIVYFIL